MSAVCSECQGRELAPSPLDAPGCIPECPACAPVDVLAVMADYSAQHGDPEDFEAVRAAVAELLEASHEFARGMPLSLADNTAVIGGVNAQALERVRAAVRSAKGMQP